MSNGFGLHSWRQLVRFSIAGGVALTILQPSSQPCAADLGMYGTFSYYQPPPQNYYRYGKPQGGRFARFGAGYYRYGNIRVETIENYDFGGVSGSMSLEFWAMPYYGALSGFIKRTAGVAPLSGGYYYQNVSRNGWIRMYRGRRWPEFNLYEYTYSGWIWRDDFLFSTRPYL